MNGLPWFDDFERIVLEGRPLIDTRAPVEFAEGAFPGAVNLPLMSDAERAEVGTCYKREGPEAALRRGHELVNEAVRRPRIAAWAAFHREHPDAILYCFRGGQRSRIAQQWLAEYEGQVIPRLRGGYKAFRRYLLEQLETALPAWLQTLPRYVLGGMTGSGKTRLLQRIPHSIDLEAIAHHRGSAFGRHVEPQPTQIAFENALAYALIRYRHADHPWLLFEDEGRNIGARYLPKALQAGLYDGARLLILETPFAERVAITLDEYVYAAQARYREHDPERGLAAWQAALRESMDRIRRRLGGERHRELVARFEAACRHQERTGETEAHREWIAYLLHEYYDPMYRYQLSRKTLPVAFRGDAEALLAWLEAQENHDG